jgi:hypothetical protein
MKNEKCTLENTFTDNTRQYNRFESNIQLMVQWEKLLLGFNI